jgi:hypothetical protein
MFIRAQNKCLLVCHLPLQGKIGTMMGVVNNAILVVVVVSEETKRHREPRHRNIFSRRLVKPALCTALKQDCSQRKMATELSSSPLVRFLSCHILDTEPRQQMSRQRAENSEHRSGCHCFQGLPTPRVRYSGTTPACK